MKNILHYYVAFIVLCLSLHGSTKAHPNLFLTNLRTAIDKKRINESYPAAIPSESLDTLSIFRKMSLEAQIEYDAILEEFAAGCYMLPGNVNLMRMRFCSIFNNFSLSLQGLRNFRQALASYEYELTKYPYSITPKERQLFLRIITFNVRYIAMFLDAELFDFSLLEQATDYCVTQPMEWVTANKGLTIIIGCVVVGGLTYYYIISKDFFPKKHTSKHATITQQYVLQQKGALCGYHAVYNAQCFLRANGDEQEATRLMNDKQEFQKFCDTIPAFVQKDDRNDADSFVFFRNRTGALLQNIDINQIESLATLKNVSTAENYFYIHQTSAFDSSDKRNAARHDYVREAELENSLDPHLTEQEINQRLTTARGSQDAAFNAIAQGKKNRVICVVNTANNLDIPPAIRAKQEAAANKAQAELLASRLDNPPSKKEILDARTAASSTIQIPPPPAFHYIALEIDKQGTEFTVADSMNWDQTKNPLFDNLYELLNNK